ncbi:MAG: hypothetical protein KAV87_56430 [Desulfobacteraceae bacterium]|nr:hypothetical protein [Desulfobacteraceae bacterium]
MKNKTVSTSFSTFVMNCLQINGKGFTIKKIAHIIEENQDLVERIRNGQQGFKINHLLKIEKISKEPLPLMLLREIEKGRIPREEVNAYKNLCRVVAAYERLLNTLRSEQTHGIEIKSVTRPKSMRKTRPVVKE